MNWKGIRAFTMIKVFWPRYLNFSSCSFDHMMPNCGNVIQFAAGYGAIRYCRHCPSYGQGIETNRAVTGNFMSAGIIKLGCQNKLTVHRTS